MGMTALRETIKGQHVLQDVLEGVTHAIQNDEEHDGALVRINYLITLNPAEGSREDQMLELLTVLVEAYEKEHETWANEKRSPQSIVKFMAQQKGISQGELAEIMGGRSRVSEFFKSRKPLSRNQILALRDALGIPADLLIA